MSKMVSLMIDGIEVSVPEGTLIVDAAKKAGIDIPVFCYHPKMEPVGMCRMCLVEVGRPVVDRVTGEFVRDADGSLKIQFSSKLETSCTTPVSEGMVVMGESELAKRGRKDILEFLLTSHPLDCPVCDKGGECPLQNLTLEFGPGQSRYLYDEKMHLAKHVPLGDLIYLDRERCIQCARCVRFQENIAGDAVIGFLQRGRELEIATFSEPGFDSIFSGNTTDICPVGALTTADFRFGARPWELSAAASICHDCPVGCNLTLNVRREAASGGKMVVKRVMPRQNEWVNEIWICDKGRFAYHYTESKERLTQPLVRKDGELLPASWEEALDLVADQFKHTGNGLVTLVGGRISNEDLFNLRKLTLGSGGKTALYSTMAGGDLVSQVGLGQGSNFSEMGPGTAILVVASDLHQEAPLWWLRVKQAAERGATLIVANARTTRLDRYAAHHVRYPFGNEAATVLAMINSLSPEGQNLPEEVKSLVRSLESHPAFAKKPNNEHGIQAAARAFAEAENAVVLYGSDGVGLQGSMALAQACANILIATNHTGRANNGLLPVWQRANDQGAWDMGFKPDPDIGTTLHQAKALYVVACDPAGDDPELAATPDFLVVQDLFLTDTAKLADVVLPALPFIEREGSLTSGERRVQRFFPALPECPGCLADFAIAGKIARRMGIEIEDRFASKVMVHIALEIPDYSQVTYARLAETEQQWPIIGRADVYYGGTSYDNHQGLGFQLAPASQHGEPPALNWIYPTSSLPPGNDLLAAPITLLYDRGTTLLYSNLLQAHLPQQIVFIHPEDAYRLQVKQGDSVELRFNNTASLAFIHLDDAAPKGVILSPRSVGIPISELVAAQLRTTERVTG